VLERGGFAQTCALPLLRLADLKPLAGSDLVTVPVEVNARQAFLLDIGTNPTEIRKRPSLSWTAGNHKRTENIGADSGNMQARGATCRLSPMEGWQRFCLRCPR